MRLSAKVDRNQSEIVKALRKAGATVLPMHTLGRGAPDLAVGYQGRTLLLEIKDGSLPPSARRLTADEALFHEEWRGQVAIVESIEDALRAIGAV